MTKTSAQMEEETVAWIKAQDKNRVDVSIIIPTIGRESLIQCLRSIQNCYAGNITYEVIVVFKDQTSSLYRTLSTCKSTFPGVNILVSPELGNGPAKNFAVNFARGEFLVFTDDDCIADVEWLYYLVTTQRKYNADIVSGPCIALDYRNPYIVAHQGHIMYFLSKNKEDHATVGTTMNLLVRKSIFDSMGGFSIMFEKHYGDDFDFNIRWARRTKEKALYLRECGLIFEDEVERMYNHTAYASNAYVKHNHPFTFWTLLKLSFKYGMGLAFCERLEKFTLPKKKNFCMPRNEYAGMRKHILESTWGMRSDFRIRKHAWKLAVLAQEVKRIGRLFGHLFPNVTSK